MEIKTTIKFSKCSLSVEGLDLNCPACGTLVRSGSHHECGIDKGYGTRYEPTQIVHMHIETTEEQ